MWPSLPILSELELNTLQPALGSGFLRGHPEFPGGMRCFSPGMIYIPNPRGHSAMSRDISDGHGWVSGAIII
jgi:hypothetical protein